MILFEALYSVRSRFIIAVTDGDGGFQDGFFFFSSFNIQQAVITLEFDVLGDFEMFYMWLMYLSYDVLMMYSREEN